MARKQHRIDTIEARRKLPARPDPYYKAIARGVSLGYRKNQSKAGAWSVRRYNKGSYVKQELGIDSSEDKKNGIGYEEAVRLALDWVPNVDEEPKEPDKPVTHISVGDACADYLTWFEGKRKSIAQTRYAIEAHILPYFARVPVVRVDAKRIDSWMNKLVKQPIRRRGKLIEVDLTDEDVLRSRRNTVNRVRTVLLAILNFAAKRKKILERPWELSEPFHEADEADARYLTPAEKKRFINSVDPSFRPCVLLALITGLRWGEIRRLRTHDFDQLAGALSVRLSKGNKPRKVRLNDEGISLLSRLCAGKKPEDYILTRSDGETWGTSHQTRPMREASQKAKLDRINFKILRHTYASDLARAGTPLQVIAEQLGHQNIQLTKKFYAHLCPDYVGETVKSNLPPLGIELDNVVGIER